MENDFINQVNSAYEKGIEHYKKAISIIKEVALGKEDKENEVDKENKNLEEKER